MLVLGWKSSKASREKQKTKILASMDESMNDVWLTMHFPFMESKEVCNGNIISNIHVEYMGSYEGEALYEDAGIAVEFKCERCGVTRFRNLPSYLDELNQYLTQHIKELP